MKQTPLPIVSGKYFFPKAPLLCLKRIPACAVTSVNSTAPAGRLVATGGVCVCAGAGSDLVDVTAVREGSEFAALFAVSDATPATGGAASFLQPASVTTANSSHVK